MDFTVYAYWNTAELAGVFNAVAALTGSGDFLGLLRLIAMIALLSVAIAVLAGRGRMDEMWKWVIMLAIFHGFLLVPKVNVVIVDRTGSAPDQVVGNVPIGIASLAATTSKIGDWLTNSFETVFALPNDVQFRKSGTLFGSRVMQEIIAARSSSPILAANVNDFFRECVWPEFATGYVVSTELIQSPDIWGYLDGRTNPARYVEIRALGTGIMQEPATCPAAYTALSAQIATVGTAQAQMMGNILNPSAGNAALRKALAESQIQTAMNLWTNVASSAPDTIRQGMVMNMMLDAQYQIPASLGDTANATTALAETQALRSTSESYKVMAAVGNHTMPKLRNIIEMIQYALAPLTLLVVIVLGQYGLKALAMYAKSLLWVQLWPPLYAVVNYIMTMYAQKQTLAMVGGNGVTLAAYSYLNNIMVSDQAIAGMIAVVGVPSIAWAMVEGLTLGASAFTSSIGSPTGAEAARFGSAAAMGNIKMGELGVNNQSMHQYNTAPTSTRGFKYLDAQGRSHYVSETGRESLNDQNITDQGLVSVKGGEGVTQAAQAQSERSETSSMGHQVAAISSLASGIEKTADYARHNATTLRAGTHAETAQQSQFSQAAQVVKETLDSARTGTSLDQKKMTEVAAMIQAGVSTPGIVKFIAPVDASMSASAKAATTASATDVVEKTRAVMSKNGFSQAWNTVTQSVNSSSFDSGHDSGRKATEGIRADLKQSDQRTEQAMAAHQEADAYKELASLVRNGSIQVDNNLTPKLLDYMQSKGMSRNAAMDKLDYKFGDADTQKLLKGFMQQEMYQIMANNPQLKKPENNVPEAHKTNVANIPGESDIRSVGGNRIGKVIDTAAAAGVNPNEAVVDKVSGKARKMHNKAGAQVQAGAADVDARGRPIQDKANKATDPDTRPSLLGVATSNAMDAVLPQGTMMLLDKGADVPLLGNVSLVHDDAAFAKPSAMSYKGSTMDAVIDTGIFAATTFGGGWATGGLSKAIGSRFATAELNATVGKATQLAERKLLAARTEAVAEQQLMGQTGRAAGKAAGKAAKPGPVTRALPGKDAAIKAELESTKKVAFKKAEGQIEGRGSVGAAVGGYASGAYSKHQMDDYRQAAQAAGVLAADQPAPVPAPAGGVPAAQGVNEARPSEVPAQAAQPAGVLAADQPVPAPAPAGGVPAAQGVNEARPSEVPAQAAQPAGVPAAERGERAAQAFGQGASEQPVPTGGVPAAQGVNEARPSEVPAQAAQAAGVPAADQPAPVPTGGRSASQPDQAPVDQTEFMRMRTELEELKRVVAGGQQQHPTGIEPDVGKLLGGERRPVVQESQQQSQPDAGQRGDDVPPPAKP